MEASADNVEEHRVEIRPSHMSWVGWAVALVLILYLLRLGAMNVSGIDQCRKFNNSHQAVYIWDFQTGCELKITGGR